jgi:hypothetical protein
VHGIDGPIRAIVDVTVEPIDASARSRVTIAVDFEGHGIGKLLVPLVVRRQAHNEMPANCRQPQATTGGGDKPSFCLTERATPSERHHARAQALSR